MGHPTTIIQRFYDQVSRFGSTRSALKYKEDGSWRSISWKEYGEQVGRLALALQNAGLESGDRVAVLAANSPQWLFADMATMVSGGECAGIYPSDTAEQAAYIINDCRAKFVFVDGGEQLAKIESVLDQLESVQKVIVLTQIPSATDSRICSYQSFVSDAISQYRAEAARIEEQARRIDAGAPCMLVYTSGTTGHPKGAQYSHKNIWFEAQQLTPILGGECLESISFLPLCHIAERLQAEIAAIHSGNTVWFAQSIETLRDDLLEAKPTVLLCVPRLWEKFHEALEAKFAQSGPIKRSMIQRTMNTGQQIAQYRHRGQEAPIALAREWAIWDKLIAQKIRAALGLARCKTFVSGAAPLGKEVADFFASLGIDILEAYGQTECVGVLAANRPGAIKSGTVGQILPDIEVKIAEDGEILLRGDNVFLGYLNQPQATAEAVIDGWLHTGDVGYFDDEGFLAITDRKKDIIVTAGGKNVAPQPIENKIKLTPGVGHATVVGDKRKYLVALVAPEQNVDGSVVMPDAEELDQAITKLNETLPSYQTIKKYAVLPAPLSVEAGELTPTMKVKRKAVIERYQSQIDALY